MKNAALILSVILLYGLTAAAGAAMVRYDFTEIVGFDQGNSPLQGQSPWVTAIFDDGSVDNSILAHVRSAQQCDWQGCVCANHACQSLDPP